MLWKRLLLLSVTIALVISLLTLHIFGVTWTGMRMEFETISIGSWSGVQSAGYYVIQNSSEWTSIWSQHTSIMIPPNPPPETDFSEKTIIAVFMGTRMTTGYAIEVKAILDTGLLIVVKVEMTYPGRECVVGEAITHAYHLVKTDKINKSVIFDTSTRVRDCS